MHRECNMDGCDYEKCMCREAYGELEAHIKMPKKRLYGILLPHSTRGLINVMNHILLQTKKPKAQKGHLIVCMSPNRLIENIFTVKIEDHYDMSFLLDKKEDRHIEHHECCGYPFNDCHLEDIVDINIRNYLTIAMAIRKTAKDFGKPIYMVSAREIYEK